jgi:hypothetical protein
MPSVFNIGNPATYNEIIPLQFEHIKSLIYQKVPLQKYTDLISTRLPDISPDQWNGDKCTVCGYDGFVDSLDKREHQHIDYPLGIHKLKRQLFTDINGLPSPFTRQHIVDLVKARRDQYRKLSDECMAESEKGRILIGGPDFGPSYNFGHPRYADMCYAQMLFRFYLLSLFSVTEERWAADASSGWGYKFTEYRCIHSITSTLQDGGTYTAGCGYSFGSQETGNWDPHMDNMVKELRVFKQLEHEHLDCDPERCTYG